MGGLSVYLNCSRVYIGSVTAKSIPSWPILSAAITAAQCEAKAASDAWRAIPGVGAGQSGLTPDSVKAGAAYRSAANRYRQAAAVLQSLNRLAMRHYAKESRAADMAERHAMRAPLPA